MPIVDGQVPRAAELSAGPVLFTPVLLCTVLPDPILGDGGVAEGSYYRYGRLVRVSVRFRFGSANIENGGDAGLFEVALPLPIAAPPHLASANPSVGDILGWGTTRDNSAPGSSRAFAVWLSSSTLSRVRFVATQDGVVQPGGQFTTAVPHTWAANDALSFDLEYLTAA